MIVALAADAAGVEVKADLIKFLTKKGIKHIDFGAHNADPSDYPDFAFAAARAVQGGQSDFGVLICGTGIGMSMVANKLKGIRCAHCTCEFSAAATREHNNANMIALGARISGKEAIIKFVDIFLSTPFSTEERHITRVNKIAKIENDGEIV